MNFDPIEGTNSMLLFPCHLVAVELEEITIEKKWGRKTSRKTLGFHLVFRAEHWVNQKGSLNNGKPENLASRDSGLIDLSGIGHDKV